MKLREVKEILGAEVLAGEEFLDREVSTACGCDLMSDVLAFTKAHTLLLTGLTNVQVIRTAAMLDIIGIVFVRGKKPDAETMALAREEQLPLLCTKYPLYETCGLLFAHGVAGCSQVKEEPEASPSRG